MIEVETNAASVAVRYNQAPALLAKTVVQTFRRIGASLQTFVVRNKLAGQVLARRTGTLARAVFYKVFLEGEDAVLAIGADAAKAKYARVQELGGVIRATHSANLAIPLDAARTAKGVARMSAREFMKNPEALGFESAFVNPKGTAIMGRIGQNIEPVFALKKQVVLQPRRYLRGTLDDRKGWILEQLGADVAKAIETGGQA